MTEKEKKEIEYIAYDWLNENEFPVNDNYEIEYSEEQLNNFLAELKEDGYSEEEITHFKDYVENFSEEREEEIFDSIPYEDCNDGIMKYTLYKNDKFIMQRKHFYPLKMYLRKTFGIKNIYISYTDLMDTAKKNYRIEVESEEKE